MQYKINSVEDQKRNSYTSVEHTRLTYFTTGQRPVQLQLVRLVGSLALFLLLCRSLARSLRCSTAKLTCHKNWNCYQLVRAFDVEDYCIKLGWCNGKCILHLCPPLLLFLIPIATPTASSCHLLHDSAASCTSWQTQFPLPPSSPLSLRELRIKVDKVLPSVAPFFPHTTIYPREGAYR